MSNKNSKLPKQLPIIDNDPTLVGQRRTDSWINATTGLGGVRDKTTALQVNPVIPLTVEQLEWLYMGDDIASIIVDSIPEDAFSKNIIIHGSQSEQLTKAFNALGGISKFVEAWKWGRLFGGGAIFMGVQDADQSAPLNPKSHGRILYTMVLERSEMQPVSYYGDPTSPKFGMPKTYRIQPNNYNFGVISNSSTEDILTYGKEVHESRLLMFGGALTPKRFKSQNQGWDASVLQRVFDVLRDYKSIWMNTIYSVADMSQGVFKIKGLTDMISEGHGDQLLQRMELVDLARSIARSVIVDAEFEDFSVVGSANMSSVSPILDQANSRIAAAARMPMTRLMGTSPGGLNATGDSDLANWYGVIDVAREQTARPLLMKYLHVIARSNNIDASDLEIEFPQLWSLSDLELAELRDKQASTDIAYIDSGVVTPQEVRSTRFVKPTTPELDTVNVTTVVPVSSVQEVTE